RPAAQCHTVAGGCTDRNASGGLPGTGRLSGSKQGNAYLRSRVCGSFPFLITADLEKRVRATWLCKLPMGLVRHCGRQVAEEGLQETILPGIGGFADCSIGELMIAIALWDGAPPSFGMGWSRSNRPILQSANPLLGPSPGLWDGGDMTRREMFDVMGKSA